MAMNISYQQLYINKYLTGNVILSKIVPRIDVHWAATTKMSFVSDCVDSIVELFNHISQGQGLSWVGDDEK